MKLSIIIPVYNSENILKELVNQITNEIQKINNVSAYEIILVNDKSVDGSWQIIEKICHENKYVAGIDLMKNVGQHNALIAGIKSSNFDYVITMDDDLQHSPKFIEKIILKLNEGYDVCYTKYVNNKYSFFKKLGSIANDKIANIVLQKPKNIYLSSFKGINKNVTNEIKKFSGPYVYLDGIILDITRNIGTVDIDHEDRLDGKSNYNLNKLFSLWIKVFTNSSIYPLRIASMSGFIITLIATILALLIIINKLLNPEIQQGWTSIVVIILFFSGVQLLALGIIGEYLGRIFLNLNQKAQFTINKIIKNK
tara:strand:- start:741 stop:1670 length:930 start_codon:yes stop_codon:yes gene_type:complete